MHTPSDPSDLLEGTDDNIVRQNIADLRRKGFPESEATAIALHKARPVKPRMTPPPTVKGQDIELLESDGKGVDVKAQLPFTRNPPPPKEEDEGFIQKIVNKTPFGKATKALKGS